MKAIVCLIAALATLAAAAAVAQDYELLLGDRIMGRETLSTEVRGDTLILDSHTQWMNRPLDVDSRTRLQLPDLDFLDYRLFASVGDTLHTSLLGDTVLMSVSGRTEREQRFLLEGQVPVPLDNGLMQHSVLLARRLALHGPEENLLALVPQILYAGQILWRDSEMLTGLLRGETLPVRRQALALAGLRSEMDLAPDGRLLSLRVPLQGFEMRLEGYLAPGAGGGESPFATVELAVEGGGPSLGATLTLPEGQGPFPAAVFLHGSGPNDRDETLGPQRVFRDLADSLAAHGIASLRYDKRTFVMNADGRDPSADYAVLTLKEEVLDDALAAFRLLRERPETDPDRCFLLGHSLGAMAAPRVSGLLAREGLAPAGLVLLAPGAADLLDITGEQYRYFHQLGQISDEQLAAYEAQLSRIRKGDLEPGETVLGAQAPYWESILFLDPCREFLAQEAPALLLFGDRDYQIPAHQYRLWQEALERGAPEGTEIHLLPGHNHLFRRGEGVPSPEEYGKASEMPAETVALMVEWMQKH